MNNCSTCEYSCSGFCTIHNTMPDGCPDYVPGDIVKKLMLLQQYRALGSVEQLKNQKQNLELAYKIIGGDSNPIGTVEEIRAAVEKQKAKKPEYLGNSEDGKILCPNCQEDLWDLKECGFSVCPYCGQAIYWTEGE